jgi:hypothetical protein
MLRTAGRLLHSAGILSVAEGVDTSGEMRLAVSPDADVDRKWLRGVTDFLLRGLRDLEGMFPREIVVSIK